VASPGFSCAGCGAALDALRAGHAAVLDGRFRYFCDLDCRARFARGEGPGRRTPTPTRFRLPDSLLAAASPLPSPLVLRDRAEPPPAPAFPLRARTDPPAPPRPSPDAAPGFPAPREARCEEPAATAAPRADTPFTDNHPNENGHLKRAPLPPAPLAASRAEEAEPLDDEPAEAEAEGGDGGEQADTLLIFAAGAAGALAVALVLMGSSPLVSGARALVALAGSLALAGRALTRSRDPADGSVAALLIAPVVAAGAALGARFLGDTGASEATTMAGVVVGSGALLEAVRRRALAEAEAERRWLADALSLPGRRVGRDDVSVVAAHELRPGEELRVEAGEIAPADLLITRGKATALPWRGAPTRAARGEGDVLVAGARVLEGAVEGVANWTGHDRAWARLLLDPARRVDVATVPGRIARLLVTQGALGAATLAALAAFSNGARPLDVLLAAVGTHASLATAAVAGLPGLHLLRGALAAARRGVAYRGPEAWDAAARVSVAVYVARGTLLLGEPDVVEIEAIGRHEADQILAWVVGAEGLENNPIAHATQRAAQRRGTAPDAVRSPQVIPGLGIKAVTSTGEALLVGSRALMLEERVSVAMAESHVTELEGLGRTVLLVAVGSRLVGLVALQDGLRPGARASVQHLLDAEIEPVFLSGDARETCETIGRALDIDHVRPEILPADRAAEVRRLVEAGARVAVLGRPSTDGPVLAAADVPVALEAAGASPGEWAVTLAGDDVRDAALGLTLAHRTRSEARTSLLLATIPGALGSLAVAFNVLPAVFAPLAGLLGGLVAAAYARGSPGQRREPPVTPWDLVIPTTERPGP
jgi:cation transport ATPase